jgi:hypothetical protein
MGHVKLFKNWLFEDQESTVPTPEVPDETSGTNDVLEHPLYQNFYNDIMGDGVNIISKSGNSIKISGPTGVWLLSKVMA